MADDTETLLAELLDGDWPLSEEYVYISSMAATERLVAATADAGAPLFAVWAAKLREYGPSPNHALVAVREGAWLRLRVSEDDVVWKLEGIAADFPMTRVDRDIILQAVVLPALTPRRCREDTGLADTRQLRRATPLLLQTVLLQTPMWTPRMRLAFSLVDYLVLRRHGAAPRINQLLERTVIAGEMARDLILRSASGIELYWPDGRKWQSPLPETGLALIPFFAGMHWSLVVYSADHGVAWIYDSLGVASSHAILAYQWLHSLKARLPDTGGRLPTTAEWSVLQQRGCECGWFTIVAATDAPPPAAAHVNARVMDVQRRWGDAYAVAQDLDMLREFLMEAQRH